MTSVFSMTRLPLSIGLSALLLAAGANPASAQGQPATASDSTVTYPASYFTQYEPYSVNDMLERIPGINVARGGGGPQGGPGSSGGSERRGLGAGGDQVLINGRRLAGKENESNSQLSRIPASQVDYIEIIRGTSGALDVRGGNQVINIVLLAAESSSSIAYEANIDHYQDGKYQPGGKASINGQRGALDYFLSGEIEPRWEFRDGEEVSHNIDGSLNDTVDRDELREAWPVTLVANLGYDFGVRDSAHLNFQWSGDDFDASADRTITDYGTISPTIEIEHDAIPTSNESWEIGGDYEHMFDNGSRFKTLFVVNERDDESTRERFQVLPLEDLKDLYLASHENRRERIVRSSYTFGLAESQDLEIGAERAQTILDSSLQLGLLTAGPGNPAFGGLTPVTDDNGVVEEMRYEYFAIHNWQINARMSLESTFLYETSEITQTGDVYKSRDFDFFRPKFDYRFDITPSLQLRATVEKDVAQLSFSDFTSSVGGGDDDQNSLAGNPDLRQEQAWRYQASMEYRLPADAGVINTTAFYHDLEDLIERVDVSTQTRIQSANGNIGDGKRYGANIDSSLRLGFLGQPEMLLTAGVNWEDSSVTDPFLGVDRRRARGGPGGWNIGFRHDLPALRMNWGFRWRDTFSGDNFVYDIDKIEEYDSDAFLNAWFEMQRWGNLTYRLEAMESGYRCRIRSRYVGGTIATGDLNEIENSCSTTGLKLALKIRGTF